MGLVGTDSTKKHYESLFSSVQEAGAFDKFRFLVYGHSSPYFRTVRGQFSSLDIDLVESDCISMESFFDAVDALASVAAQEGFGRPIAAALMCGVPCFLLERPVFREFFASGAELYGTVPQLVDALLQRASGGERPDPGYAPPPDATTAYESAVQLMRELGSSVPPARAHTVDGG